MFHERLQLAVEAAREAGEVTLRYFGDSQLKVDRKADASPVTRADREAETCLRNRILETFPEDGILGEEHGTVPGTSGFRWILDPIDGTKSFIHGVPLYGTLVGVEYEGRVVVGVIHIPALGETVYAASGEGAWYVKGDASPRPTRVSTTADVIDACVVTSEVKNFDLAERREAFFAMQDVCGLVRTWGDCYGYLLVATGRADVAIDPLLNPWDAAALVPVIEEAGGRFTDWNGQATFEGGNGLATNGRLHQAVLELIAR
ncbi:histidinol-phosphatase [Thermostilla marina]